MAWFAGILLIFSLLTVCMDVGLRYFFNSPTGWVLQISEYILLYIPFLGATIVLKEDRHIRVDIILDRLDSKAQSFMNVIASVIGFCVLSILAYYGSCLTLDYYKRGVPTLDYIKMPEFLVIIIIPIGCFFLAIEFLRRA
jgi:TRAP-type C4-dicarboxylate transport system permease small subunit